jgi:biotin carboxyl carrier protein
LASEIIEAPITGKIIEVNVSAGDQVKEGSTICVIEAMKMKNKIFAPVSGAIKEIKASAGQVMQGGDVLAVIEY